jgi:AcrR family transcriptional regulator
LSGAASRGTIGREAAADRQYVAIAELQRARILAAIGGSCAEHGAARVTVSDIVSRAGVSRRTFYELYGSCEECMLDAIEHALARARTRVVEACRGYEGWRERLRAGLAALLELLEAEPRLGRLLLVDWLGAGQAALARRSDILAELHAAVDAGRHEAKGAGAGISRLTAEASAGGVLAVLYSRLVDEARPALTELLGPLMSMLVLPYLGPSAARAELERSPAAQAGRPREPAVDAGNPLKGLNMRVTYRTMRVLHAIGERPGASNKEIGANAGIQDQGQISKLLARLQSLELIVNEGGRTPGEPNAWRLTERGSAVCGLGTGPHGLG